MIAEIGADGAVSVQPPLLPELSVFGPQSHFSSGGVPASNHIKACVTGLKVRKQIGGTVLAPVK